MNALAVIAALFAAAAAIGIAVCKTIRAEDEKAGITRERQDAYQAAHLDRQLTRRQRDHARVSTRLSDRKRTR